jgi:hypothetical protein
VRDTLEEHGWEVLVADAQKVKGLALLACKTDRIDARVLAELSWRELVPAIWLPDPTIRRERERELAKLLSSSHRTARGRDGYSPPVLMSPSWSRIQGGDHERCWCVLAGRAELVRSSLVRGLATALPRLTVVE